MKPTYHKIIAGLMLIMAFETYPFTIVIAQNAPDSTETQRLMIRRIRERFAGVQPTVDRNGRLLGMGTLDIGPLKPENAVDRIYQFLEQNSDLFDILNARAELPLAFSRVSPGGHGVIEFDQVVNGIKVLYAGLQVNLGEQNRFIFALSWNYYPEARDINTTPSIDSLRAFEIAQSDPVNSGKWAECLRAQLIIVNFPDGLHLTWNFFMEGGGYYDGESEYFIDAHTGEVLKIAPGARY